MPRGGKSVLAGMAEAAAPARGAGEILDDLQLDLHDRHEDELRDPLDRKSVV